MRLIALLLLILGATTVSAANTTIEGQLTCTIKHQEVTKLNDGKLHLFGGFKKRAEIGDALQFFYKIESSASDYYVWFELVDKNRKREDSQWFGILFSEANGGEITFKKLLGKPHVSTSRNPKKIVADFELSKRFAFNEDVISISSFDTNLGLNRYYKGDYTGLFTHFSSGFSGSYIWVATLDCRTRKDSFDEFFDFFRDAKEDID